MSALIQQSQLILAIIDSLGQLKIHNALISQGLTHSSRLFFMTRLKQLNLKELFKTHSLLNVNSQHFAHDLLYLLRHLETMKLQRPRFYTRQYIQSTFTLPRQTFFQSEHRCIMMLLVVKHKVEN